MPNLKKNSWQTALYKYFWNTNKLPDNLCPYFWKLVVMYICIIPYAILSLPFHVIDYFASDDSRDEIPTLGVAFIGALIYIALSMIVSMILMWFFPDVGLIKGLGIGGFALSAIGLLIWLVETIKARRQNREIKDFYNGIERKPKKYVAIEFIKAKYNKYCPTINWS